MANDAAQPAADSLGTEAWQRKGADAADGAHGAGATERRPHRRARRRVVATVLIALALLATAGAGIYLWWGGALPIGSGADGFQAGSSVALGARDDGAPVEDADAPLASAYGDGAFVLINRGFENKQVKTAEDALTLLDSCVSTWGIEEAHGSFAFEDEQDALGVTHYRFEQQHRGVPVYGRAAVVAVDASDACKSVAGNALAMDAGLAIEPSVSQEDAAVQARKGYEDTAQVVPNELTIYSLQDVKPRLTWCFDIYDPQHAERVFIDAASGDRVAVEPLAFAATIEAENVDGMKIEMNLEPLEDDRYRMHDQRRNLMVFDAHKKQTAYEWCGVDERASKYGIVSDDSLEHGYDFFDLDTGERYTKETAQGYTAEKPLYNLRDASSAIVAWNVIPYGDFQIRLASEGSHLAAVEGKASDIAGATAAVTLYGRLANTIDYYETVLNIEGFNGENGAVRAVANDKLYSGSGKRDEGNGYTMPAETAALLRFDNKNKLDQDYTAHELTHALEFAISCLDGTGEAGALKEAVCDIFGEAVEDWSKDGEPDGDCDWLFSRGLRNLKDPHKSTGEENGRTKAHPATYGDKKAWGDPSKIDADRGYVHNNSTVISHAGYLMCAEKGIKGEALSTKQLAQLVYLTLHATAGVKECTFAQFRVLTESCARTMRDEGMLAQGQFERVMRAFDAVNVARPGEIEGFAPNRNEDERQQAVLDMKARRDIALVLDISESMNGEPLEQMKEAAQGFVGTVLEGEANCALVTYSADAAIACGLTSKQSALSDAIDDLSTQGRTNMEAGMRNGEDALADGVSSRRIMVLMSDGHPNEGLQGDELITYARRLKDHGIKLYTVGFNEGAEGYALLSAMASDGCHYEVRDSADLEAFFADIADEISGTRYMYVRAACPVEVSVAYGGEELSSAEGGSTRTSFGSLAFEDELDENGAVIEEDAVKVARLKEGPSYTIDIRGTGEGSMDYSIGFANDEGDYDDFRTFDEIEVTPATQVTTMAEIAPATALVVDVDGDGVIDQRLRADAYGSAGIANNGFALTAGAALACAGMAAVHVGGNYWWLWRTRRRRRATRGGSRECDGTREGNQ